MGSGNYSDIREAGLSFDSACEGYLGHIRRAAQSKGRGSTQGERAGELLPPAGPTVGERKGGVGEEVILCPSVPPSADMGTLALGSF